MKYGTGTFLHPLQTPESIPFPQCYLDRPSQCCKEKVHIFAINGLNPLCLGNFNGLCKYCKEQGFENVYFGQLYTSHGFATKARDIRAHDPDARIALVGFSLGANYVRAVANSLRRDGVKVDLVAYLVGDLVKNTPRSFPDNVCRVLNVRAKGLVITGGDLFFNGEDIDGARNVHLTCRHILVPSRRETLEAVMDELMILACFPLATGPAITVPLGSVPATPVSTTKVPATTIPAATIPLSAVPASGVSASSAPAALASQVYFLPTRQFVPAPR